MKTVESVERTIQSFSSAELAEFRRWFMEFDSELWDTRIEADAVAGKLDALASEALAEYRSGTVREL